MSDEQMLLIGRLIAVSHTVLLTGLLLLCLRAWDRVYAGMIGAGAVAFLTLPLLLESGAPPTLVLPVFSLQIALTFWFWLYALAVRSSNFRPGLAHWSVLGAKLLVTIVWAHTQGRGESALIALDAAERTVWRGLVPALFSMGLTISAVFIAGNRLGDELDGRARRLRQLLVYWGAAAIFVMILLLAVLRGERLEWIAEWLSLALVLAICVSIHVLVLRAGPVAAYSRAPRTEDLQPESALVITEEDAQLAKRIETCLRDEEFCRTEGLTIAMLSSRLGEKEYRVRRAINSALGYRNFNVFVNEIRVAFAKATLRAEPDLPVIRLAMDLGYRSLAGFNKAFKAATEMTPTEFRRRHASASTSKKPD
ncbi:MAG: helix-turn-helix domain-containing protein [bacterium]|nr:helix-turn-helix domain-containing protein [bacterium]